MRAEQAAEAAAAAAAAAAEAAEAADEGFGLGAVQEDDVDEGPPPDVLVCRGCSVLPALNSNPDRNPDPGPDRTKAQPQPQP